ncbi:MAG: TIGR03790 family protein [Elusimicrobia bacterium]|nr:TIGR03790 family protein [Elusimicrobiota bacterium]
MSVVNFKIKLDKIFLLFIFITYSNFLYGWTTILPTRPSPDRVLVVVNDNSQYSKDIAAYYKIKRNIPDINIMHYTGSTNEAVDETEYTNLATAIKNWITNNNLHSKIDFIVLTKGTPLTCSNFSVCNELVCIDNSVNLTTTTVADRQTNPYDTRNWWYNTGTAREESFSHQTAYNGYNLYLVTRLDGYTVEQVKTLIDNSVNASSSTGTFLFDGNPNYPSAVNMMEAGSNYLVANGYQTVYDNTSTFLTGYSNLMGYYSWGSNEGADFSLSKYQNNSFRPGSLGDSFVSSSGRTFNLPAGWPNYTGQSLIADLIIKGITGVCGFVSEPYADAVTESEVLLGRYTSGYNLAESFYMACPYVNWKAVIIGDPLCAPYYKPTSNTVPTLSWTGETSNYISDGLSQETGTTETIFTFRVKYTDADWDIPKQGTPKLHIKKDGEEISDSPFTMTYETGTCISGAIYSFSTMLSAGTDYTYYFEAKDIYNASAIGGPTTPIDAPDVTYLQDTISPSVITTLAVSSIGSNSVILNWCAPGDNGTVGTATTYDIRYTNLAITESSWNTATLVTGEPIPQIYNTNQTYTITGLSSNTTYYFAIKAADEKNNWSLVSNSPIAHTHTQQAYPAGVAWNISSGTTTIQLENFDMMTDGVLGQGEAYYDTESANQGGGVYRTTEGVDVEATTDIGGGYDIGWTYPGEWLEYSINVQQGGEYKVVLRVAGGSAVYGPVHLEFGSHNGTPTYVTKSTTVYNTGGWQTWTTFTSTGVMLTSGTQVMKLVMESGTADSCGNFNYINIIKTSATDTTPPIVSGVTPTNITGSGAVITWTTNELANSKVHYGTILPYGSTTTLADTGGVTNHSVILSSLTEKTVYHYRIVTADISDNPTTTDDYTFTTIANDSNPPIISNITAGVSTNTAVITWNTDENSDSQVEYGLTTTMDSTTTLNTILVNIHNVSLSELKKGTTYYYRVYSRDSFGNLATSAQYSFKTYNNNIKHRIYKYYYDDLTTPASLKFWLQVYNLDEGDNIIAKDYTGTLTLKTKNSKGIELNTVDETLIEADAGEKDVSIPFRSDLDTVELSGDTTAPVVIRFSDMYISKLVGYQGGTIRGANGLKILIPAGVLSANKYLAAIPTSVPSAVGNTMRYVNTVNPICYDFGELTFGESAPTLQNQTFTRAVNITIPYTAADIGTLNEDGLRIYYWTGTDWDLVAGGQIVDKANNTVTATVKHFSTYRILGSYVFADMSNIKVYPNPYNPNTAVQGKLKVINIPVNSIMKLYSVAGELVRELKEMDYGNFGWIEWNGKNDDGDKVGRGVYIYKIEDGAGNKKTGKIGLVK